MGIGCDVIVVFQVAAISAGIANLIQVPMKEGCDQEENMGGVKVWTKRGQMAFEALMRMLDNKVPYYPLVDLEGIPLLIPTLLLIPHFLFSDTTHYDVLATAIFRL